MSKLENTMKPCLGRAFLRFASVLALGGVMASCSGPMFGSGGANLNSSSRGEQLHAVQNGIVNNDSKFSVSSYGVAASPRLTSSTNVPKGGGRYMVGSPYKIAGRWYHPGENTSYNQTGTASWYGPNFHGRMTANGETFDQFHLSGAHTTLPLPSYVRVQNLANGRSVVLRINDRGPFAHNRLIDVSKRAAEVLGFIESGTAQVRVTYIGRAPVEGDDTRYLVASIDAPGGGVPSNVFSPSPATRAGTRPPSIIGRQSGGLIGSFVSLFSYAGTGLNTGQGTAIVSDAHAAVNEVAEVAPELEAWKNNVEAGQVHTNALPEFNINSEIGVFFNMELATEIARQFAFLGAVEQQQVVMENGTATRLILRELKSGVTMLDIDELADRLNLSRL